MHSNFKKSVSYSKAIFTIGFLTVLFAFGSIMLGYLFMPLASATYAALLLFENKYKRILSYIIPVAVFVINFFLNGIYSLEAITYVFIGFLIYVLYSKRVKKNDAVFFLTGAILISLLCSVVFVAFKINDSTSLNSLMDFYSHLYYSQKEQFIDFCTNLISSDSEGISYFVFTTEYAENAFHSLIILLPALSIIIALILSGLSLKMFRGYLLKYSEDCAQLSEWNYIPSAFFSYTYICVAVLNLFLSSTSGVISVALTNLYYILLAVFAYMGIKFVYSILRARNSGLYALILLLAAIMLLTTTAFVIFSYIGVYFSITLFNKSDKKQNKL